jgi:hypothetical protein
MIVMPGCSNQAEPAAPKAKTPELDAGGTKTAVGPPVMEGAKQTTNSTGMKLTPGPSGVVPGNAGKKDDVARLAATKATVSKLNALVMQRYESYMTRRVPLDVSGMTPQEAAEIRLFAVRDLMRMEMPERWSDISNGPLRLKSSDGKAVKSVPQPPLHRIYQYKYGNPAKYGAFQRNRNSSAG